MHQVGHSRAQIMQDVHRSSIRAMEPWAVIASS